MLHVPERDEIKEKFAHFAKELQVYEDHDSHGVDAGNERLAGSVVATAVALYHAVKHVHIYLLKRELVDFCSLYDDITTLVLFELSEVDDVKTEKGQRIAIWCNQWFPSHYKVWSKQEYRRALVRVALDRVVRWFHVPSNLRRLDKIVDSYNMPIARDTALSDPGLHAPQSAAIEALKFFVELSSYADVAAYLHSKKPDGGDIIKIDAWHKNWVEHSSRHAGQLTLEDAWKSSYEPWKKLNLRIPLSDRNREYHELRFDCELQTRFEINLPALMLNRLFPNETREHHAQHQSHSSRSSDIASRSDGPKRAVIPDTDRNSVHRFNSQLPPAGRRFAPVPKFRGQLRPVLSRRPEQPPTVHNKSSSLEN